MKAPEIQSLVSDFRDGRMDRQQFVRSAVALGVGGSAAMAMASSAVAQATPGASPMAGEVRKNEVTREEAMAAIDAHFDFEEPQNTGGDLIYQNPTDIGTLNPLIHTDTYSQLVTAQIYETLVEQSVVDGTDVPTGLADGWEISADGIEYTVFLNPNVKWHDGEPFTADDVVFTFDAVLAEDSQSVRKGTVEGALERYEKIDDHTVKFYAKTQSAVFLTEALRQFGIMPMHIWKDVAPLDWPADSGSTGTDPSRVIGTGPFKFQEWKLGESITLVRNDEYWGQHVPHIDRFVYQVVVDASTVIAGLETGSADVGSIGTADAKLLADSYPELQIVDVDTTGMVYFICNQDESKTTMFSDTRVRQAMMYALDRPTLADIVYDGYAVQADGTQPVLSIAYAPERVNTIYDYDPEKAAQLLEEAGWVDTDGDGIREKDGEKLSFDVVFSEGTASNQVQIPYMQDAWRQIGMDPSATALPFQTMRDQTNAGDFDVCVQGFSWRVDGAQDSMFASWSTPPNGFNKMRYSNEAYDELVEPSKQELDQEKRIDILIEQSNIVNDDAALGILVFRKSIYGAGPNVHNFFPTGYSGYWWLSRAWVDAR